MGEREDLIDSLRRRVAMPTTPDAGPLPYAQAEAALVHRHLPDAVVLADHPAPTREAVLTELTTCSIAHFACHGVADSANPAASRLLLQDHERSPLPVATLLQVDLTHARLAFLSACQTAAPGKDVRLMDETIHLATAFQLVGFRQVVGTLWPIDDRLAAEIADVFYSNLCSSRDRTADPDRAPVALHDTIRTFRDRFPGLPSLWAAYIHGGT